MKATKLLLAAALLAGLATFALAGPPPQFWSQQDQNRKETAQAKAQPADQAKVQPATQTAACANCNCNCAAMKKT
jgi:hypothetical protein